MASLLLGVVGRAVLGPVGGILGTLLGGGIDRRITRQGDARQAVPELQAASYGEPIPVVRGRMRLSGNVVWAAPIRETAARGGKRGGSRSGPTWSASFAVLLARGSISGIGRVWADGRLLRNAAGEWLLPVTMRLLPGTERQLPDPLIVAAEGQSPAFRGLAVAVFEDLPLAEFGNRLPTLAFEVFADPADVDLGRALADVASLAGMALPVRGGFPQVAGLYLGRAGPLGDVLAPAALAAGAVLAAGEALVGPGGSARTIDPADAARSRAAGALDEGQDRWRRDPAASVADAVELAYFDAARDYQPGLQRARLRAGPRVDGLALPLVLEAASAKQLGQQRLLHLSAARQRRQIDLPWRFLGVRPGDLLQLDGDRWQVRGVRFAGFVLSLVLARVPTAPPPPVASDAGTVMAQPDAPVGPTRLLALDLPPLPGELPDRPRLWLAAAGTGAGWRRCPVAISLDDGASWQDAGDLPGMTVIGAAVTVLPPALPAVRDRAGSVEVALLNPDMWLESRPDASVLAGANLAVLGDEIIQFAQADAVGPGRFRLSGLLRGRRGSEWAADTHVVGERFVLLDAGTMLALPLPLETLGQNVLLRALGAGDAAAVPVAAVAGANGLAPLAPVHLRAVRAAGQITARWIAQSRAGFGWPDGTDVPPGEAEKAFRVSLLSAGSVVAEAVVTTPEWTTTDRPGPLVVQVRQMGLVPGRAATLAIA